MNIPSLTPRDVIEIAQKRKWWGLGGECLTKRFLTKSPVSIEILSC